MKITDAIVASGIMALAMLVLFFLPPLAATTLAGIIAIVSGIAARRAAE
jgi:hypothetical protein